MERECTFAPVIDARSAGMMSHRSIVLKVASWPPEQSDERGMPKEGRGAPIAL